MDGYMNGSGRKNRRSYRWIPKIPDQKCGNIGEISHFHFRPNRYHFSRFESFLPLWRYIFSLNQFKRNWKGNAGIIRHFHICFYRFLNFSIWNQINHQEIINSFFFQPIWVKSARNEGNNCKMFHFDSKLDQILLFQISEKWRKCLKNSSRRHWSHCIRLVSVGINQPSWQYEFSQSN